MMTDSEKIELLSQKLGILQNVLGKHDTLMTRQIDAMDSMTELMDSMKKQIEDLSTAKQTADQSAESYRAQATELLAEVKALKAKIEEQDVSAQQQKLMDYVEDLVDDFQDSEDEDKGANMVAFNPALNYDEGTVGHLLKSITKTMEYEPTFFNLGTPIEVIAGETVKVIQTNIKIINPKNVLPGRVHTLEGGAIDDILLISARGSVVLTAEGNMLLKSEYEMVEGRVIALRKSKANWAEIWRSH